VSAISAGRAHCLAMKSNGTVAAWGANDYGQCDVPAGLNNVVAVVAPWNYSLILKSNGTVVGWGEDEAGQTDVPAELVNVVAIAGNMTYAMALKADGSVVAWGHSPNLPLGLADIKAIAAGEDHSLALSANGSVIAWGADGSEQTDVPSAITNASAIGAGWNYSLALVTQQPGGPTFALKNPTWTASGFSVSVFGENGKTYSLEYTTSLKDSNWASLQSLSGTGSALTFVDSAINTAQKFYRVRQQ